MKERNGRTETTSALRGSWNRLWSSPWPTVGCEISHAGISLARWSGSFSRLDAVAWRPIPAGAVEASPLRENILQPEPVRQALAASLASLGIGGASDSDAVLVIPDQAARLFVLNFDALSGRPSEALAVVKWRLKKSVPFDIETASISYFAQRLGGQWQVVAVATPQTIVRQYEALAEGFGLRPRWVTLSTLAALGLVREFRRGETENRRSGAEPLASAAASGPAAVLVAKYSLPWLTTAILQGGYLRLFRTVGLATGEDGLLSPVQLLEALFPSVAYFQDNFEGSLERAYLCGLGENSAAIRETVEQELHLRADLMAPDPGSVPADFDSPPAEEHFAALLGIVREQRRG